MQFGVFNNRTSERPIPERVFIQNLIFSLECDVLFKVRAVSVNRKCGNKHKITPFNNFLNYKQLMGQNATQNINK